MMDMEIFLIDGLNRQSEPDITKYGYDDLGDSPENHRWRAWWCDQGAGIHLRAYPVVKKTPKGAWIDDLAWREYFSDKPEWNLSNLKGKFVFDGSGQSWAKMTQEEAIESLAIRLCRWSTILAQSIEKAQSRSNVLSKLRPDLEPYATASKGHINKAFK